LIRSPIVTLTDIELAYSDYIAQRRLDDVRRWKRRNRADVVESDSEARNHILGAQGEHAFAKWLGIPREIDGSYGICPVCRAFSGTVNTFGDKADVGRYQVRTRSYEGAPLIVRDVDKDDDVFVLVDCVHVLAGIASRFNVVGWMLGEDAKQYRFRKDPKGRGVAYFVPANELRSMMDLPREEEQNASQDESQGQEDIRA